MQANFLNGHWILIIQLQTTSFSRVIFKDPDYGTLLIAPIGMPTRLQYQHLLRGGSRRRIHSTCLFGEMTITLDDVYCILDIPITGRSVSTDPVNYIEVVPLVSQNLGVSETVARDELLQCRGNSLRLDWLYQNFGGVSDEDSHW